MNSSGSIKLPRKSQNDNKVWPLKIFKSLVVNLNIQLQQCNVSLMGGGGINALYLSKVRTEILRLVRKTEFSIPHIIPETLQFRYLGSILVLMRVKISEVKENRL